MDAGQSQICLKRGHLGIAYAIGAGDPPETFFRYLESRLAGEDPAQCRQGCRVEAQVGFFVQLALGGTRRAAAQAARALGVGNQFAKPQQNMLMTGQSRGTGLFHYLDDPYPGGRNEYVERVEANLARLVQVLSASN